MENAFEHWEGVYQNKTSNQMSWTQSTPELSLKLIEKQNLEKDAAIIDIGAGESLLIEHLLKLGYTNLTVLEISQSAIDKAKQRLGSLSDKVVWICADITKAKLTQQYDLWHDRACFHFLTKPEDIVAYVDKVKQHVKQTVIISGFSINGPLKCSGLEVKQQEQQSLSELFSKDFNFCESVSEVHTTPFDTQQDFIYSIFNRSNNKQTMQYTTDITFDSERLHFQIVNSTFKQAIFDALTPEVAKFLPFIPTGKIEDTQGFIDYSLGQLKAQKDITLVATDKQTNEFIGCCGIHDISEQSGALGIWLKEAAYGKGYGTELITALEHFINEHMDIEYILYHVEKDNHSSIKIAEKLGYQFHTTFERNIEDGKKFLHMLTYRKLNKKSL